MPRPNTTRTFYGLILTQALSLIGSRISGLAISIYIFQQTGNATPLALVAFFFVLPQVLTAGLAGALADRWNRRYMLVLSDAGQALGSLLLLLSFASGSFQLWHLYAVTLLQSIFSAFQAPAFQASMTLMIPDDQRDRANAIQQLTGPVSGIIAPALAGVIYGLVGVVGSILIDLATFLVAVLVVYRAHIPQPKETAEGEALRGSMLADMFNGFRWLRARPSLFALTLFVTFVNFLVGGIAALETPYILSRVSNDETVLGVLLTVLNLGALAGGIVMSVWDGTRPRIHTVMGGIIVSSLFLALSGMAQSAVPLGLALFLFMFGLPLVNAAAMSMLQAKTPPDVQGRVFAATGQMSMLMLPLAYLLVGPLADQVFEPAVGSAAWSAVAPLVGSAPGAGMGLLILAAGAINLVLSLFVYTIPSIRRLEADLPDHVPDVQSEAAPASIGGVIPDASALEP